MHDISQQAQSYKQKKRDHLYMQLVIYLGPLQLPHFIGVLALKRFA